MGVNVSGRQLRDPGFAELVRRTLRETGVLPGQLTLEITETAMLADLEAARRTLTELRAAGVCVALDDFGAGYSSLAYLRELPLDTVKIDRAFVSALEIEADRRAMLLTIVRLLSSMEVRIVAEGVETAAQLQYLASMGVHAFQGWYFSRALPAVEVLAAAKRGWAEQLGVALGAGAGEAATALL